MKAVFHSGNDGTSLLLAMFYTQRSLSDEKFCEDHESEGRRFSVSATDVFTDQ
jgi:hypothetical protein